MLSVILFLSFLLLLLLFPAAVTVYRFIRHARHLFHYFTGNGAGKPSSANHEDTVSQQPPNSRRPKIFAPDEGEYVDYEET